jgi:tetratricopeptide (TPR) repeat protein
MGRYKEAEQLFKKTLALRLEILPENHPDIMQSYWWLATIASRQENYQAAIAYYQKAINMAQGTLGENHPDTIQATDDYYQMLLEAPTEEILKALPEEMHEGYLKMRSDRERQKEQG